MMISSMDRFLRREAASGVGPVVEALRLGALAFVAGAAAAVVDVVAGGAAVEVVAGLLPKSEGAADAAGAALEVAPAAPPNSDGFSPAEDAAGAPPKSEGVPADDEAGVAPVEGAAPNSGLGAADEVAALAPKRPPDVAGAAVVVDAGAVEALDAPEAAGCAGFWPKSGVDEVVACFAAPPKRGVPAGDAVEVGVACGGVGCDD